MAATEVNRIETSEEVGFGGQFIELLDEFLTEKHRGENRDDILQRHPWLDDSAEKVEYHKFFFRLQDLQKFLNDSNFKIYSRGQIVSRLMSLGGGKHEFVLKGKFTRVWWVPFNFTTHRTGPLDSPPLKENAI